VTPLTELAQNAAVGRRTAVAAAGGALLVSTFGGAMAAQAAPMETGHAKMNSVDLNALTSQARESLTHAPVVTVAPDAELVVEKSAVSVVSAAENEDYQAELAADEAAEEAAEVAASTVSTATSVDVPASAIGNSVISIASRYVGVPYVSGGASPSGFDCSGFTQYVFSLVGISLPRTADAQRAATTRVSNPQPGDLVFFGSPAYHVGIYAGNGMMWDSPRSGKAVALRSIWSSSVTYGRP
jgi:peptidoglycan DL-endopeptidase CwlO